MSPETLQVRPKLYCSSIALFFRSYTIAKARTNPPDPPTQTLAEDHKEHTASNDPSTSATSTTEDTKVERVYRSLLSQQVPVEELSHLEPDHPGHVLKKILVDFANGLVDRLLEIAPALDTASTRE